eukprot:2620310-Rhodomonas_salina.1
MKLRLGDELFQPYPTLSPLSLPRSFLDQSVQTTCPPSSCFHHQYGLLGMWSWYTWCVSVPPPMYWYGSSFSTPVKSAAAATNSSPSVS